MMMWNECQKFDLLYTDMTAASTCVETSVCIETSVFLVLLVFRDPTTAFMMVPDLDRTTLHYICILLILKYC